MWCYNRLISPNGDVDVFKVLCRIFQLPFVNTPFKGAKTEKNSCFLSFIPWPFSNTGKQDFKKKKLYIAF